MIRALGDVPERLAEDLVDELLALRFDTATHTFERSIAGKFVETVVQILQFLETGDFEQCPDVERTLKRVEAGGSCLDVGLRVCVVRVTRAMQSLRNKRNIVHKAPLDTNVYDLRFLLAAAQWTVAELIRVTGEVSMEEAGRLVDEINAPVEDAVEDIGGRRLVVGAMPARDEALALLHSHYPQAILLPEIMASMKRRSPGTVRNVFRKLWKDKLVEGDNGSGYVLTRAGHAAARNVIARCA